MTRVFAGLRYIVVDELHAFIGTERGRQLQSLMQRVEFAVGHRVQRIALSATLGDVALASEFLRPGNGDNVVVLESQNLTHEIRLQVKGYLNADRDPQPEPTGASINDTATEGIVEVSRDLYRTLRGGRHLAFANSRRTVESLADLLRRLCERDRVPNEFFPHHGNLSKELRYDAELRLREGHRPATIIATTTLELGIDVGSVETIAQIGVPPSVASMRQRLGRSGRKEGTPSVLRVYIQEPVITGESPPTDLIRANVVQTVAMVRLLILKWNEPPIEESLHLSTLVQQTLSIVAQYGGSTAQAMWEILCETGPFKSIDKPMFARLLRSLASHDLITQMHDGTIVLGLSGERLVNHYDFYAAFTTLDEYRVVSRGTTLGSLPISHPLMPGEFLIFAGRRWTIVEVDQERRVIDVEPSVGGRVPKFNGNGVLVHDHVRREMWRVYCDTDRPPYLDTTAADLLTEGRSWFNRLGLAHRQLLTDGEDSLLFPWAGDRILNTIVIMLTRRGLRAASDGPTIRVVSRSVEEVQANVKDIIGYGDVTAAELAFDVANKIQQKHHRFLSEELLSEDYASESLDVPGALRVLRQISSFAGDAATFWSA